MKIPSYVNTALHLLKENGFESYIVGGSVRDYLLNTIPNDWDITTSAKPEEMLSVFSDYKCVKTGLKHGTITIIIEKQPLEITTFRIDGPYSDARHPDSVLFSKNLTDDLARRDFTINALACDEKGVIVDPYGGKIDMQNKCIRCVGNADTRFKEDALRILRGLRFAATLGYTIEEETARSMERNRNLLRAISVERVYEELNRMLVGEYIEPIMLQFPSIFTLIVPELKPCLGFEQQSRWHQYTVYTHIVKSIAGMNQILKKEGQTDKAYLCWTMLLHDIGKPEKFLIDSKHVGHFFGHPIPSAEKAFTRLKAFHADNKTIKKATTLIREHDVRIRLTTQGMLKLLKRLDYSTVSDLILVQMADHSAQSASVQEQNHQYEQTYRQILREITDKGLCFTQKDLQITGEDCKTIGIQNGKDIKVALELALDAVIAEKVSNEKDALLQYLQEKNAH